MITLKRKTYRMRIEEDFDPDRPDWADPNEDVFLYDHPVTRVGYLTDHFFAFSFGIGTEIPAWGYDSAPDSSIFGEILHPVTNEIVPMPSVVPNTMGVYDGQAELRGSVLSESLVNLADIDVLRFWPVGRQSANGGCLPHYISERHSNNVRVDYTAADGLEIIEQGGIDFWGGNFDSPWGICYAISYLGIGAGQGGETFFPNAIPTQAFECQGDAETYDALDPNIPAEAAIRASMLLKQGHTSCTHRVNTRGQAFSPKTWPSYLDGDGSDYFLYPDFPQLGEWSRGGREIGITGWQFWTGTSGSARYASFYNKWYQNYSLSFWPGNMKPPYGGVGNWYSLPYHCGDIVLDNWWYSWEPWGAECIGCASSLLMPGYVYLWGVNTNLDGGFTGGQTASTHMPGTCGAGDFSAGGCSMSTFLATRQMTRAIGPGSDCGSNCAPTSEEHGLQIVGYNEVSAQPINPLFGGGLDGYSLFRSDYVEDTNRVGWYQFSPKMSLDEMWGTSYDVGGFYIQNRGLAYHLRNAVDWENLGSEPYLGGIYREDLFEGYGSIMDGMELPIPPAMTFAGGGGLWGSQLKGVYPYSEYSDLGQLTTGDEGIENYYSNWKGFVKCSFVDYPNMSWVYVRKPEKLLISNIKTERVCPEYMSGDMIIAQHVDPAFFANYDLESNGYSWVESEFIDLNLEARQIIDYSKERGTLEPYYDYFPDTYIPFETEFLLPKNQKIPTYSFNCSKFTYTPFEDTRPKKGERGPAGPPGGSIGERGDGEKGSKGLVGAQGGVTHGGGGDKGGSGFSPGSGQKGQKGQAGPIGPQGETGTGLFSGGFGGGGSRPENYWLGTMSDFHLSLGTAGVPHGNNQTTIGFSTRLFGACTENADKDPEYHAMHVFATDFVEDAP